jgi:signal transduction histidine kinase
MPAAVGITGEHGELERRIVGLLNPRRNTMTTTGRKAAYIVMSLFIAGGTIESATRFVATASGNEGASTAPVAEQKSDTNRASGTNATSAKNDAPAPSDTRHPDKAPAVAVPERTIALHGKVLGPADRPIAGARLYLNVDEWTDPIELGTSDANGAYGKFFGTLCAIDPKPAQLKNTETVEMFRLFADLIVHHLDSRQRLISSEKALLNERETSQLREQFIAVLGHDLRNPLGAIRTGADLLAMLPKGESADEVRKMIQRSVTQMTELIDNVFDSARGRLGGGLSFDRKLETSLESVLTQVISELEVAQMFSNILANALTHGDPASPVWVKAWTSSDRFQLSVTNLGETIPAEIAYRD